MCNQKPKDCYLKKWSGCVRDDECGDFKDGFCSYFTPPPHLVKISSRKLRHALSFSLECTDFKNIIFEKIHWAHSEDAEVAEVKQPRNPK